MKIICEVEHSWLSDDLGPKKQTYIFFMALPLLIAEKKIG